jgi:SPP1 family predicted phage head-tail adaptor
MLGFMSITLNILTRFKGDIMKLKDKKIEVLAVTTTKGTEGFTSETLQPIAPPLWAYFRQLSGKEIFAAQSVQAVEEVLFIVNWRDDITTVHVVRYRGTLYDIPALIRSRGTGIWGVMRGGGGNETAPSTAISF